MKHKTPYNRPIIAFFLVSALLCGLTVTAFSIILNQTHLRPGPAQALNGDIAWRVFDGGVDDPGANYSESALTTGNVGKFTKLWETVLPATADNSVVEEPNVSTAAGTIDLVFVNTIKGNLVAYNAATGTKIWEADPSSSNFNGQGTKSTPAIDPSGNYVYAYALDGYIHKYAIGNGSEVTGSGFPAQITLLPNNVEKGSASINIANGYLYMTISGNDGDYGHYVGHVVAVNLSSGTKTVWNAECANIAQLLTTSGQNYCSNTQSGIWARPGVKVDPVTGNVFVATGNGNYNASSGGNNWGDSVVELKSDLSQIVDSYTPTNYSSLDSSDADLGSTAPVLLPKQNGSNTPYMAVQAGKDDIVKLLNRTNLSGQGGPGHTGGELQTISISDETHEQPAVWTDGSGTTWVYVTDESGDLYAYKVVTANGTSSLSQAYHVSAGVSSSPFVANGVLYLDGPHILALNATTGATLFNSSSIGISLTQHWEAPVVVNGTLFTPDDSGNLIALYVPGAVSNPAPSPTPSPTPSPSPSSSSSSTPTTPGATTTATASSKASGSKTAGSAPGTSKASAPSSTANPQASATNTPGTPAAATVSNLHAQIVPSHGTPASRILQFIRTSFTERQWGSIATIILVPAVLIGAVYLFLRRWWFRKHLPVVPADAMKSSAAMLGIFPSWQQQTPQLSAPAPRWSLFIKRLRRQ